MGKIFKFRLIYEDDDSDLQNLSDEEKVFLDIQYRLGLSVDDTEDLITCWRKFLSPKLDYYYNQGVETGIYAVGILGDFLQKKGIQDVKYVSGDYKGWGHWWNEVKGYILDFGNGIDKTAIETGHITPKFLKASEGAKFGYYPEDVLIRGKFIREMLKQGYPMSAFVCNM